MALPPALDGTALRIPATSDLGATTVPLRTSYGEGGTCAGVAWLLDAEREPQPTIWLDLGDLVVGTAAYPLLGERPWSEVSDLPIAAPRSAITSSTTASMRCSTPSPPASRPPTR
jgi:hypothetical protein